MLRHIRPQPPNPPPTPTPAPTPSRTPSHSTAAAPHLVCALARDERQRGRLERLHQLQPLQVQLKDKLGRQLPVGLAQQEQAVGGWWLVVIVGGGVGGG